MTEEKLRAYIAARIYAPWKFLHEKDTNIYEVSGGNYDDAYDVGVDDGRQEILQEIKAMLEGETCG